MPSMIARNELIPGSSMAGRLEVVEKLHELSSRAKRGICSLSEISQNADSSSLSLLGMTNKIGFSTSA
jgi:hypothetical protein